MFQLYHGSKFYWWSKQEYPENTVDLSQITDKLYHILYLTNHPYLYSSDINQSCLYSLLKLHVFALLYTGYIVYYLVRIVWMVSKNIVKHNLIKIRSTQLLPIFYRFFGRSCR
jgi:hypothetical protein